MKIAGRREPFERINCETNVLVKRLNAVYDIINSKPSLLVKTKR